LVPTKKKKTAYFLFIEEICPMRYGVILIPYFKKSNLFSPIEKEFLEFAFGLK